MVHYHERRSCVTKAPPGAPIIDEAGLAGKLLADQENPCASIDPVKAWLESEVVGEE